MKPVSVYFSLGTNQGDRRAQIAEALRRLDAAIGRPFEACSSIVESPAWGFEGPDFLNCVVRYRTARRPETLLRICKRIERAMGRRESLEFTPDGRRIYHDRPIDIDILLYGDAVVDTPDLKIPHPLMQQRDFIMGPLGEIFEQK